MMKCEGSVCCEIYRDKKWCKAYDKANREGVCKCIHATLKCFVEPCWFESSCEALLKMGSAKPQ